MENSSQICFSKKLFFDRKSWKPRKVLLFFFWFHKKSIFNLLVNYYYDCLDSPVYKERENETQFCFECYH